MRMPAASAPPATPIPMPMRSHAMPSVIWSRATVRCTTVSALVMVGAMVAPAKKPMTEKISRLGAMPSNPKPTAKSPAKITVRFHSGAFQWREPYHSPPSSEPSGEHGEDQAGDRLEAVLVGEGNRGDVERAEHEAEPNGDRGHREHRDGHLEAKTLAAGLGSARRLG